MAGMGGGPPDGSTSSEPFQPRSILDMEDEVEQWHRQLSGEHNNTPAVQDLASPVGGSSPLGRVEAAIAHSASIAAANYQSSSLSREPTQLGTSNFSRSPSGRRKGKGVTTAAAAAVAAATATAAFSNSGQDMDELAARPPPIRVPSEDEKSRQQRKRACTGGWAEDAWAAADAAAAISYGSQQREHELAQQFMTASVSPSPNSDPGPQPPRQQQQPLHASPPQPQHSPFALPPQQLFYWTDDAVLTPPQSALPLQSSKASPPPMRATESRLSSGTSSCASSSPPAWEPHLSSVQEFESSGAAAWNRERRPSA